MEEAASYSSFFTQGESLLADSEPHDIEKFLRKWKPLMTQKSVLALVCGYDRHRGLYWSALKMLLV